MLQRKGYRYPHGVDLLEDSWVQHILSAFPVEASEHAFAEVEIVVHVTDVLPMGLGVEHCVAEQERIVAASIWCPNLHQPTVAHDAHNLSKGLLRRSVSDEMFKRVATVDVLNCVIGKRQRFALDVEHEVDVRPGRDVDAEEAVTLVSTTPELDARCRAQSGPGGRLHCHAAMIDGCAARSNPVLQPVKLTGLAPHTRMAVGGRYRVTMSPPTALLRDAGVPALKLRLLGSDRDPSGGIER